MQWQYLESVEPILPRKYARGWFPDLPDLVRRAPALPVALVVAACAFVPAPVQAAPVTIDRWYQPLSEPAGRVPWVDGQTGAERPLEVPRSQHLTWYQPLSEPISRLAGPPQGTGAEAPSWVAPVQAIQVSWLGPLEEPSRRLQALVPGTATVEPIRPAPARLAWLQPLSEPSRRPSRAIPDTGAEAPVRVPVAAVVQVSWLGPLSEPTRRLPAAQPGTGAEAPIRPAPARLTWLQPLSEPIPARRLFTTETGGERPIRRPVAAPAPAYWFQALSEPTRLRVPSAGVTIYMPVLPIQRVAPPLSWLPVIEPLRRVTPAIQITQWTVEAPVLPTPTDYDAHNNIQPSIVVYIWRRIG